MTAVIEEVREPGVYPVENALGQVTDWEIVPETLGPTWDKDPEWNGPRDPEGYILPRHTLGWQAIHWIESNLLADETDENDEPLPFKLTREQMRFILWFYAINEFGHFTYREIVLQRLKGWGKDPIAACIAAVEFVGPCRFKGWVSFRPGHEAEDAAWAREHGLSEGDPYATPHPRAWIQIAAVSLKQTQNTMLLFMGLFTPACKAEHGIDIGKETIYAYGGQKKIEAVTSSPASLEGNRPTLVIKNEALTLDTPIPTPAGWTTMGELKDGDTIYGADGRPTTVTKAHEVQHGRRVFEVVFSTGDVIKASDGHWWKVRLANNPACTLHEMTTLEMFESGREFFPPRLPVTGVDFQDRELPVDPYILGLWLGDGHARSAQIACDPQDIDEVAEEMGRLGVRRVSKTGQRGLHLVLADTTRSGRESGYKGRSIQSRLRQLGVLGNKHIPDAYMTSSLEQRLALLQGLFDSDGSIREDGSARFANVDVDLLDQVRDLLLSVGYDAKRPNYQAWGDRPEWRDVGMISVVAHVGRPLFRLARKARRMRPGMPTSRPRKIVEIREISSEPVRCISVEAEDKLFMAGRDFHATRNTHHWRDNNEGTAMADAIERNATKAKGGAARTLSITNAYQPSQESVAQSEREAYEDMISGLAYETGTMYDSLEAPRQARLKPIMPDDLDPKVKEQMTRRYLTRVLEVVRGGAWWLDIPSLVNSILNPRNAPSRSRRFWFNQVVAAEDVWLAPAAVEAAISQLAKEARDRVDRDSRGTLEAGWIVLPEEPIVVFFDGSKSHDATGLVGCRLSDGYVFTLGVWQKPPGKRGENWLAPREAVNARVAEVFKRFNVVAFWGDPSHAKDDEDATRYWDGLMDSWMRTYAEQLEPAYWPVKGGHRKHAIMFDMAGPEQQKLFVAAAETFVEDMESVDDIEEFAPTFEIDGHPALVSHLKHAIRCPTTWGITLMKEGRESVRKIDLAVCAVGARMLRRVVLNTIEKPEEDRDSTVWGVGF